MASAQDTYRAEFRSRILALEPRSVLEVGCGAGTFLRSLTGWTGRLVGVDVDEDRISELKSQGFNARKGSAEELPFDDAEFDVVASSYTAHHLPDWPRALIEGLRVARRAMCILDVWYDETIPSQRVAADYDRWSKEIDRTTGMVHNPCLSLGELIAPIARERRYRVDVVHRLLFNEAPIAEFEAYGREQLAKVTDTKDFTRRYESIMADAKCHGISHDGAVMVTISKQ
jgi:ubiquinone/menaquinone biosynthesis C-methylase UbiE